VWEPDSGRTLATLTGHNSGEVWSVAFSSDGHQALTGGDDGTVRVWDPDSGRELARWYGDRPIRQCVFAPDRPDHILIGDSTGALYVLRLHIP
jgi:WD40 repeat protein